MKLAERRRGFRAILAGNRCVHPASVFDPLSARIAEEIGFEAMMFAGSTAAAVIAGVPDLALITMTELAEQVHRICRAASPPLLVDADHGYGNALNVMRTVEELETAGLAAMTVADMALPAAFGEQKVRMISIEEGMGKMRAALAARSDPGTCIIGRTVALSASNLDDAVARVCAYESQGVDGMFCVGVSSREQLDAIFAASKMPILLGVLPPDMRDLEYLASRRVRICLQGQPTFTAAYQAVQNVLTALHAGMQQEALPNLAPRATINRLTRSDDHAKWTKDFLGG